MHYNNCVCLCLPLYLLLVWLHSSIKVFMQWKSFFFLSPCRRCRCRRHVSHALPPWSNSQNRCCRAKKTELKCVRLPSYVTYSQSSTLTLVTYLVSLTLLDQTLQLQQLGVRLSGHLINIVVAKKRKTVASGFPEKAVAGGSSGGDSDNYSLPVNPAVQKVFFALFSPFVCPLFHLSPFFLLFFREAVYLLLLPM